MILVRKYLVSQADLQEGTELRKKTYQKGRLELGRQDEDEASARAYPWIGLRGHKRRGRK